MLVALNPSIAPSPSTAAIDAFCIEILGVRVACFYPNGVTEIGAGFVRRIVQVNAFAPGDAVSLGAPWILADSSFNDRPVTAIVIDADGDGFIVMVDGFAPLESHGKGSSGDVLWSSVVGGTVTAKPTSGTLNFQRIGTVLDADTILVNIEHGETF